MELFAGEVSAGVLPFVLALSSVSGVWVAVSFALAAGELVDVAGDVVPDGVDCEHPANVATRAVIAIIAMRRVIFHPLL
ncbi:hypothetical protein [Trueperella sp. LYQ143]|uniref:hypothetical protein n=1 Tax=Trueperella sp. LYQ143 TaxID=3391059 RepID=UPI003982D832